MSGLQQTTGLAPQSPRVDFERKAFDDLIAQKGKDVIIEKALRCPCKNPSSGNALSTCKNCGGCGWIFVNPYQTRMIMQKINLVNDFTPWSEENRGFVNISFNANEELTFMDKITDVNGIATFNQILFFKEAQDTTVFAYTAYPIKEIKYIGLFKADNQPLQRLVEGVDYTFTNNIIKLINSSLIDAQGVGNTSISVRYKHAPVFFLMEMKRETMETFEFNGGGEQLKHLPLSAIARRAHYILNTENLTGTRLLSNNYSDCNVNPVKECAVKTDGNRYDFLITQGDTFYYSLNITENGMVVDITTRQYKMQVKDANLNLITEFTVTNGGLSIQAPNTLILSKTTVQTAALPIGSYIYDLQETIGTVISTILSGRFIVVEQVTT